MMMYQSMHFGESLSLVYTIQPLSATEQAYHNIDAINTSFNGEARILEITPHVGKSFGFESKLSDSLTVLT